MRLSGRTAQARWRHLLRRGQAGPADGVEGSASPGRRARAVLLGLSRSWPMASAALAAYTLGRQFLLGLRADPPRRTPHGGQVTVIATTAALIASIVIPALGAA